MHFGVWLTNAALGKRAAFMNHDATPESNEKGVMMENQVLEQVYHKALTAGSRLEEAIKDIESVISWEKDGVNVNILENAIGKLGTAEERIKEIFKLSSGYSQTTKNQIDFMEELEGGYRNDE